MYGQCDMDHVQEWREDIKYTRATAHMDMDIWKADVKGDLLGLMD